MLVRYYMGQTEPPSGTPRYHSPKLGIQHRSAPLSFVNASKRDPNLVSEPLHSRGLTLILSALGAGR